MFNWAGNYEYKASRIHTPKSVEELQAIVRNSRNVRALGSRHCFNDIADCPGADLVSMAELNRIIRIDQSTVTIESGVTYGQLCPELNQHGLAVHNLASLPHISVAGACMTATHGSGDRNQCLSSIVVGMKIVGADGEIKEYTRAKNPEEFPGIVVSLGALGIVVELTLKVEPSFSIQQTVFRDLSLEQLKIHFDEITSSAYSVSCFTDWTGPRINQVWLKHRVGDAKLIERESVFYGATPATIPLHPLEGISAENCTEQLGVAGPWYQRLPHFKLEFTPSNGVELQSEYLVPRKNALAAIEEVYGLREKITPYLQISEIRTIAADDLWMSPFYQQDCVGIHFTWKQDWPNVSAVLPLIEERLIPLGAKPHWGKLFAMRAPELQQLYGDQLVRFKKLIDQHDPDGKFRNPFLMESLYP